MKTKSKFLSVKDTTISFLDFVKKFSTEHKALVYLENLRWENGVICPFCGEKKVYGFAFTASHMTYKQFLAKEGSNLLMRVA